MATRILFACWSAIPALLLLVGQHRLIYDLLGPLPELAVAAATGLLNLSWYEIAYVIGTAAKRPVVYVALPWVAIASALLPALALAKPRLFRGAAALHLAIGLLLGGLAFALVAWRTVRGFGDSWRLATSLAFCVAHGAWGLHFVLRRAPRRSEAPAPSLSLQP